MQKRVYLIDTLFHYMKKLIICTFSIICTFLSFSQTKDNENQLALLYYSQGEYEKAADLYKSLFNQTHSQTHFDYLIACYQELNEQTKAEKITNEQCKRFPKSFYYQIKLATIEDKIGNKKDADEIYTKTIKKASKDLASCLEAGKACKDNNVEIVAQTIYENGHEKFPDNIDIVQNLGEIYLKLGENQKLTDIYISLLQSNEDELQFVENQLQYTLFEKNNPQLQTILEKTLEIETAKEKNTTTLRELYAWLFTQEKNFSKAIEITKQIDTEKDEDGDKLYELGTIALENKDYTAATDCFSYVVQKGPMGDYYDAALKNLLETSYNKLFKTKTKPDTQQILALEAEYKKALTEIGETKSYAELAKNLAHIQAFYLNKVEDAITLLQQARSAQVNRNQKSSLDMELADIQIYSGDIWSANMLYASIAMTYKNNDIGHTAQLQQAEIAYYNGEFAYAQALLDVLKGSTSKLISNDAFELSQLISDNTALDTTTEALTLFAHGDLLLRQQKYDDAIATYDSIIQKFLGHSLEDDVLMRKADIALITNNINKRIEFLQEIENRFPYEIYTDKAIYELAIYFDEQGNIDKAKEKYKKLIFEYPNSFFASEARKRYRELNASN